MQAILYTKWLTTPRLSRGWLLPQLCAGIFINVGRGDNVDEDALVAALSTGEIAACCLDVFEHEPLPQDSKLWQFSDDRILLSPVSFAVRAFA